MRIRISVRERSAFDPPKHCRPNAPDRSVIHLEKK
jgi:hypothetical protein